MKNIVQGYVTQTDKEFIQLLHIALGTIAVRTITGFSKYAKGANW